MAVSTDASRGRLIDLDIHTEACITTMTCGAGGGAVSLWAKVTTCSTEGIITTTPHDIRTGFVVACDR